ncbi:hypothetical protein [Caulobacter rhizosphaerae]|jgi:hypothetical protein|uniref:hypothetical protein n=1 Tax=Caulobacter rhizosphaerae TaxID=2010972 RepID=UPI00166D2605|nr:hypothetical protein [Caulobacter rhizosphaerae]
MFRSETSAGSRPFGGVSRHGDFIRATFDSCRRLPVIGDDMSNVKLENKRLQ